MVPFVSKTPKSFTFNDIGGFVGCSVVKPVSFIYTKPQAALLSQEFFTEAQWFCIPFYMQMLITKGNSH